MFCQECSYCHEAPSARTCRGCGRYLRNKHWQPAAAFLFAAALAILARYALTGSITSGPQYLWLQSALTAPCSIYESPQYLATVALALTGLVIVPIVAALDFGILAGSVLALVVGLMSGFYANAAALPVLALVAGHSGRKVPPAARLLIAAALGAMYYIAIAWLCGPASAPLYRRALLEFMSTVALLILVLAAASGALASIARYSSLQAVVTAAVFAAAPAWFFFTGVGPGRLEASFIEFAYSPARSLAAALPEGYASGTAERPSHDLTPERQMRHVVDAIKYVDWVRVTTIAACDGYLNRYPLNGDTVGIMMLKAEMHNARVDVQALKRYNRLETYSDRVAPMSVPLYQGIAEKLPGAPEAALSRYYLALAAFQAGNIAGARTRLADAIKALLELVPPSYYPVSDPVPATVADLYHQDMTRANRIEAQLYEALTDAVRTQELIARNSDFGGQPLARFAALDQRSETFAADATKLITDYRTSEIVDNVKLTLAERMTDPVERRNSLDALLDEYPKSDVRDRMLVESARADLAGDVAGDGRRRAELKLRRLLADYPASTYNAEAGSLLARITAASKQDAKGAAK